MHWSFGEMLAYASRGTELRPGDVIGSGTVGTGCILEVAELHGADRYPYDRRHRADRHRHRAQPALPDPVPLRPNRGSLGTRVCAGRMA